MFDKALMKSFTCIGCDNNELLGVKLKNKKTMSDFWNYLSVLQYSDMKAML